MQTHALWQSVDQVDDMCNETSLQAWTESGAPRLVAGRVSLPQGRQASLHHLAEVVMRCKRRPKVQEPTSRNAAGSSLPANMMGVSAWIRFMNLCKRAPPPFSVRRTQLCKGGVQQRMPMLHPAQAMMHAAGRSWRLQHQPLPVA